MENMIFIPNNVPSSKNSRITSRSTGRSFPSKLCQQYVKDTKDVFILEKDSFLKMLENKSMPYKIGFHLVRETKRKCDFHNMVQLPLDLMTKNGWIEDDNMDIILPFPMEIDGKFITYDKLNPGVYIKIL